MKKYQLKIELCSDLCVSDGGVCNSYLDTDICHDRYGFPYIPAKRIKGCLRECALELNDWGMDVPINALFGNEGCEEERSQVRIGDAHLRIVDITYDEMVEEVENGSGNNIFHPEKVLDAFSYTRTQTSVDYETGSADPKSLRTIRVANKGLFFVAEVELEDDSDYEAFKACCDSLTRMGIGRTRGLGEVRTELEPCPVTDSVQCDVKPALVPGATKLTYELELLEPMVCKSVNGGEANSLDYIDGSKILGLVVSELKKRGGDYRAFIDGGKLFCANAYPEYQGVRCREVPANFFSVKNNNEKYLVRWKPEYIPPESEDEQLNSMKHCYIPEGRENPLIRVDVDIEERYHHRRPEDKSIGRADPKDGDSQFYQISSIEAGQKFIGYVSGSEEQIKTVYDCLSDVQVAFMGYSHSAEYGKTAVRILETEKAERKTEQAVECFSVKLESPVLVYNENAFYSTDAKDLDMEIRAALGLSDMEEDPVESVSCFLNYTMGGGYNVTWDNRKPSIILFDKGTVLNYHLKKPVELSLSNPMLIGERISEGYGEISVSCVDKSFDSRGGEYAKLGTDDSQEKDREEDLCVEPDSLADILCGKLFADYVKMTAAQDAESKNDIGARPTVSNMLQMCMESSTFEEVREITDKRYGKNSPGKPAKLLYADEILKETVKRWVEVPENFRVENHVQWNPANEEDYKLMYLKAYLTQMKYNFRGAD